MTKQGGCFERPHFIMANRNRNIVRRMPVRKIQELVVSAGTRRWCRTGLLVQDWVANASLVVRSGGHWCRTCSCCCRTGSCCCRKVVVGAGRWSLVQEGSCWCRTGGRWCRKVVTGTGRWSLV